MTPKQRATELADHCRYCGMPDYRPKCKADYEHQVAEIAAALEEAARHGSFSPPCGHGAWIIYNDEREWCGWCELKAEAAALREQIKEAERLRDFWQDEASRYAGNSEYWQERMQAARVEGLRELAEAVIEASNNGSKNFYKAVEIARAAIERGKGEK